MKKLLLTLFCTFVGSANASLIPISSADLLGDNVTLDFESSAQGVIGSSDNLFTNFGFSNVQLLGSAGGGDSWNSGTDGRGLAANSSGELIILDNNDEFNAITSGSSFAFNLDGTITQLGFQLVDQVNNSLTIETYLNGIFIDSIAYNPTGSFPNPSVFFESSLAIDEFRVVSNDGLGWGLDNITIAGLSSTTVSEPGSFALLGLGLAGMGFFRKRESA